MRESQRVDSCSWYGVSSCYRLNQVSRQREVQFDGEGGEGEGEISYDCRGVHKLTSSLKRGCIFFRPLNTSWTDIRFAYRTERKRRIRKRISRSEREANRPCLLESVHRERLERRDDCSQRGKVPQFTAMLSRLRV
jgi:hypothetical protein